MKKQRKRWQSLLLVAMLLATTIVPTMEAKAENEEVREELVQEDVQQDVHQEEEILEEARQQEEVEGATAEEVVDEETKPDAVIDEESQQDEVTDEESQQDEVTDEESQLSVLTSEESQEEVSLDEAAKVGCKRLQRIDLGETDDEIFTTALASNRYAATAWDKYSSKYFYNQMSSAQKQLYDSAYNVLMAYLTTNNNAEAYNSASGLTAPIFVPDGMSAEEAEQVIFVLSTNNPQFYFVNEYYGFGSASNGNYIKIGIYPEWVSGASRTVVTSQISSIINSWMSQINAEYTTLAKEKKVHDLIVSNTTYAYSNYDQSCAGVFLEGKAVCAGYSEAFALLCNGIGINTICVTSAEHEWNIVQLYGNWYIVDCTWDDQDDGNIYDWYFNKSDAEINEGYHEIESVWNGLTIPACTSDIVIYPDPIYNGVNYSAVYNEDYYVTKYADVRNAYGADSNAILAHFVNYGMKEGRQAKEDFNVNTYKNRYVDLRNAYGKDLKSYYLHYINCGKKEGRSGAGTASLTGTVTKLNGVDYSAVYDYNYYISKYADIKRIYGGDDIAALQHFVNCGMKEGRQAISGFQVQSYYNRYSDLRRAYGNDLKSYYLHYIRNGKKEGRTATGVSSMQNYQTVYNGVDYSAVYDYNYYVNRYSDIKKAYGIDDAKVLQHFVNNGMKEKRQGSASFEVQSYYNKYQDLRRAYGSNWKSYYLHYINCGKKEGRTATGVTTLQNPITTYNGVNYSAVYDYNYYLSKYADIKRAYEGDENKVLQHFVNYGMREGRQASASFNVQTYKNRYADLQRAFGNNLKSYYQHYITFGIKEGRSGM